MKQSTKRVLGAAITAALMVPMSAWATNGMNLEGYGPISLGMGGTGIAFDSGTAGVMINPATLGLMDEGNRFDAALGFLGPDVKATAGPFSAKSSADAFYMPAVGWVQNNGQMTYGVAMFAQGGMGTEYAADSFLALGSGDKVRSEVGVGRLIAPLVFEVDDSFMVGGSLDFVWAGMDVMMAMPTAQLGGLVTNASAGWGAALPGLAGLDWARFDFSNNSDYTGEAMGTGLAAKLGMTYRVNSDVRVGATYHSKTSLGDLKGDASMSAGLTGSPAAASFDGKIEVNDFEWPAVLGVGVAYQASDRLLLALDVKRIKWASVMESFKMTFKESTLGDISVALPQEWDDQNVISLGAAYQVNDNLIVRAGFNKASNPIPDAYLNPLFPAIVEKHLTLGAGYAFDQMSSVDFAISKASEISQTGGSGIESTHSQLSWQVMYSRLF